MRSRSRSPETPPSHGGRREARDGGSARSSGPAIVVGAAYKAPAVPVTSAGMSFTTELKTVPGTGEPGVALTPVFQTAGVNARLDLPLIPGASR